MSGKRVLFRILRITAFLVCLIGVYLFALHASSDSVRELVEKNKFEGALLFACLMFSTTVIAPLTSLPLVPMVAMFLGPFVTGLACFIGWTMGAIVAFLIARHFGQPFVVRFISTEKIQKYEQYLPPETSFMLIVVLRMIVPVDLLSYALGLFSTVPIRIYVPATMLGIFWFSFAFAYGGDALMRHDYVLLSIIGVASVVILYSSWRYARSVTKVGVEILTVNKE